MHALFKKSESRDDRNERELSCLIDQQQLIIKQKAEVAEIYTGVEEANVYAIYNSEGKPILRAVGVENDEVPCMVQFKQPFAIDLMGEDNYTILSAKTSDGCVSRRIVIECPPEKPIAYIEEPFAWFAPTFWVRDTDGLLMFKIVSPMAAAFGSWDTATFKIYAHDEKTKIGEIAKEWSGMAQEMFTDTDTFALNVPADMDINWKAVLLTVLFLIDFTFYEQHS